MPATPLQFLTHHVAVRRSSFPLPCARVCQLDSLFRDGRGVVSLPACGQRVAQHSRVPYAQLSVADKLGVVQTMRPNLVWMTMHTK